MYVYIIVLEDTLNLHGRAPMFHVPTLFALSSSSYLAPMALQATLSCNRLKSQRGFGPGLPVANIHMQEPTSSLAVAVHSLLWEFL